LVKFLPQYQVENTDQVEFITDHTVDCLKAF